jgi:hypothetical protein
MRPGIIEAGEISRPASHKEKAVPGQNIDSGCSGQLFLYHRKILRAGFLFIANQFIRS